MSGFFPGVRPVDLIPGDPQELRWLAGRLGVLAGGLGEAAGELAAIDGDGWKGLAADAFRQAIELQPGRYRDAATGFSEASSGLLRFANALESAQLDAGRSITLQQDADQASAAWHQRQQAAAAQAVADAAKVGHPSANPPPAAGTDPGDTSRAQAGSMLSSARAGLDAAAASLRATLASAQHAAPTTHGLFNMLLAASRSQPGKFALTLNGIRASRSMVQRELRFMRAFDDLETMTAGPVAGFGPRSMEATTAWVTWQTTLPASLIRSGRYLRVAQEDWYGARYAAAGPSWLSPAWAARAGTLSKWGGRVSGPLMVLSSVQTMASGSKYSGTRGTVDRWVVPAGGASAGLVFTAAAIGMTIFPPVLVAAGVVAVGVGAWELGNIVYDNRRAIGHGIAAGSSWVWHHSVPGTLFDRRDDIKHAVTQASAWGSQQTHAAVDWTSHHVSDAKQKVGNLVGSAESGLGDVVGMFT